jgi:signal transduction histidine kinase
MFSGPFKRLQRAGIRLTLWHGFFFLLVFGITLSLGYWGASTRLLERDRDNVTFRLGLYAAEYERGGLAAVQEVAALRQGRAQRAAFLRVSDSLNRTVFLRDPDDWSEFSPEQLSKVPVASLGPSGWREVFSKDGDTLMLAHRVLSDGFLMELGVTDEDTRVLLSAVRKTILAVLLLTFPLSLMGGMVIVFRTLAPLRQVTETASQMVETANFGARVPAVRSEGAGPLGDLVSLFNRMLERMERLLGAMRESLDNVAHDLRTPLTRIQQRAQHALSAEVDEPQLRETLADCVEETQRASVLLDTLMEIAEAECAKAPLKSEALSLGELLRSAADLYQEVAQEKGVSLELELAGELPLQGDGQALLRVFANLIDNAIKYTPQAGKILIRGESAQGVHRIVFSDTGIGIASADLPHIWNRLFRADRSRAERGLGLGLSFVRALVEAHKGSVSAVSCLGRGTEITLIFPTHGVPQPA